MNINNCIFPDNLLYDPGNFTWTDISNPDSIKIGITPILSSISGKINRIKVKERNLFVEKGKSLGSLESLKYFGVIRSPLTGKIKEINFSILEKPKLLNDSPYEHGWVVKLVPLNLERDLKSLKKIEDCKNSLKALIDTFKVRCFKAFPDHEMYELGTECATTLMKLGELLTKIKLGEIVYLVSDDITADLELTRWSQERSHTIIDMIKEDTIFHFLIRKDSNN